MMRDVLLALYNVANRCHELIIHGDNVKSALRVNSPVHKLCIGCQK